MKKAKFLIPQLKARPQLLVLFLCLLLVVLAFTSQFTSQKSSNSDFFSEYPVITPKPFKSALPLQTSGVPQLMPWRGIIQPVISAGTAQVFLKVPTDQPVIFVGIDDGITKDPATKHWLVKSRLPFTMFLDNDAVKNNYAYFQELQAAGLGIENHTMTHPKLTRLNFNQQANEICAAADTYEKIFGRRPTLFRPPYGSWDENTRRAAWDCGMKAIIMWHAVVGNGAIQYQDTNNHFEPGDIVLMHFHPDLLEDMKAFAAQAEKDHLQVARLEDWIR